MGMEKEVLIFTVIIILVFVGLSYSVIFDIVMWKKEAEGQYIHALTNKRIGKLIYRKKWLRNIVNAMVLIFWVVTMIVVRNIDIDF